VREQQRYLLDAILEVNKDGVFDTRVPFLTLDDLMHCSSEAAEHLGVVNAEINRNTIQGWLRAGVLREPAENRTRRNRLYSTLDVIRLVAVRLVAHMGVRARVGAEMADEIINAMSSEWFTRVDEFDTSGELDARDLVWVVPGSHGSCEVHGITARQTRDGANKVFSMSLRVHGAGIAVDARMVVQISIIAAGEKHKQKLIAWADKLKLELKKAQESHEDKSAI